MTAISTLTATVTHSTRPGKIARLPRELRESLNRRLEDGEPGPQLLGWLNALPEVRALLAAEYEGRAINEQNLSGWRQGGFLDWQRRQEARSFLRALAEEKEEMLADGAGQTLAEQVTTLTLLALGRLLQNIPAGADPKEERQIVFGVAKQVAALHRAAAVVERAREVRARRAREEQQDRERNPVLSKEERIQRMRDIFGLPDDDAPPCASVSQPPPAPAVPLSAQGNSSQIKVDQGEEQRER